MIGFSCSKRVHCLARIASGHSPSSLKKGRRLPWLQSPPPRISHPIRRILPPIPSMPAGVPPGATSCPTLWTTCSRTATSPTAPASASSSCAVATSPRRTAVTAGARASSAPSFSSRPKAILSLSIAIAAPCRPSGASPSIGSSPPSEPPSQALCAPGPDRLFPRPSSPHLTQSRSSPARKGAFAAPTMAPRRAAYAVACVAP